MRVNIFVKFVVLFLVVKKKIHKTILKTLSTTRTSLHKKLYLRKKNKYPGQLNVNRRAIGEENIDIMMSGHTDTYSGPQPHLVSLKIKRQNCGSDVNKYLNWPIPQNR